VEQITVRTSLQAAAAASRVRSAGSFAACWQMKSLAATGTDVTAIKGFHNHTPYTQPPDPSP
jgi:hypothetical protein